MSHRTLSAIPRRIRAAAGVAVIVTALGLALAGCTVDASASSGTSDGPAAAPTCLTSDHADAAIADAQELVNKAAGPTTEWDGPTSGSPAPTGKNIVFIAANANNQGDIGVYKGVQEAAAALDWNVTFIDGQNSTSTNLDALNQAISLHPDAIAVSSYDAKSAESAFEQAKAAGIPVIGNHTGEDAGYQDAYPALYTNVTSDPVLISQVAAACAVVASNGTAGVTLTSCGGQIQLCLTKEDAMKAEIEKCSGCKVLGINHFPFEEIAQREAGVATADYQKFGSELGYMLSINDLYWDTAIPALSAAGVDPSGPPVMIAAGDGSPAAYDRIRNGQYQIATVAEPLNEHGWQVVDEIVRALNSEQPTDFVTYPHLVTIENVDTEGGDQGAFDPDNGYRAEYQKIWGVG